ncbi:hypothetical protein [Metamycoplasma equirhinis]|uniref:hypothetical protein n=1 Tax=Metamycoplasma equirhinis TaxID=92402 RepID=UPI003593C03E
MFNFDYEIAKNINENLIKYDSDFKQNFNKYIKNINLSDYFKFLELEIFKYNKNVNYKLNEIKIIHDKFNNPYIYANFNPFGYIIVSLVNNESIIIEPLRINNNFFDFKTKFNWFNLFSYGKPNNVNINTKDNFLFNEYSKKYFDLNKNLNDINLINEKKILLKNIKKILITFLQFLLVIHLLLIIMFYMKLYMPKKKFHIHDDLNVLIEMKILVIQMFKI